MGDPMTCIADGEILVQPGKDKVNAASSSTLIDARLEKNQSCGTGECPSCGQKFECKEAIKDWPELPAGVRFDPTDQELLEHLEAKVNFDGSKPHPLIDEFIPTLEGEDGICYTHPEKLPGVKRDGHNKHFFHRPSKAYTTGTRKRRKIQTECDLQGGETRWHKTGKTRPVMVNGRQKGCKKILVLYTNFGKHRKPEKTNWVMHQYHLGLQEEEKEGELVVSKVFYQTQPRQCNWERAATDIADTAVSSDIINRTHDYSAQNFMNQGAGLHGSAHIFAAGNSMPKPPAATRDDGIGPSTYNAEQVVQHVKTDYFPFAPCKSHFDHEGISDSGKGSESSQGTPHSCDEHEEHEGNVNAAKQTFCMSRDIRAPHFDKGEDSLIRMEIKVPRELPNPEAWAAVSPHPNEGRDMVFDENMTASRAGVRLPSNAKLERQIKIEGRPSSSPRKLTFEDIFMPDIAPEIKEEAALTNSQETDWLKSFWPDPDSAEHHRLP